MLEDRREAFYSERIQWAGTRYRGFDLLTSEMVVSFVHTYDLLHQATARYMADYGLSKSTMSILMLLRCGPPAGMQLHDLGELLLVSKANITGLIDHLEEKGYVNRVVDPEDRRARYARITAKAEALLDEFMPVHYRNVNAMLQDLTGEEKRTFIQLLKKARGSITAHFDNGIKQDSIASPAIGQ